jgi:hypothetical protein
MKDDKLSTNCFYEQKIRLEDKTPVFTKNYRIPHNQKEKKSMSFSYFIVYFFA